MQLMTRFLASLMLAIAPITAAIVLHSNTPGRIVYEDEYQIVVVPRPR